MAQIIGSIIPLNNLDTFDMKRVGFQCRASVVNPIHITRPVSSIQTVHSTTTDKTKTHLSNLEKLLKKEAREVIAEEPRITEPGSKMAHQSGTTKTRRMLDGLNLACIWPEGMPIQDSAGEVAAEMSPRRLIRLQQLLSKQPEYSPRNHLGTKWREYHGSKNWAGLLDPLDQNLRREVVRYGEFIQAAYQSFHSDPATTQAGISSRREVGLPDKSYKVTKSLYATSSIGFPKWVDDVAPDLNWMTQRSSWVGYIAVCENEREISRMGRRDIIIALRGTATCLEWVENARAGLTLVENSTNSNPNPNTNQTSETEAKVECGFLSLFQTKGEHIASLSETVVREIRRLLDIYKGETLSITITGHSLGAALALLVADEISTCAPEVPPVAVFSFGGPKVGNRAFANRIRNNNVKVLRIVNNQDLITKIPGIFISDQLNQKLRSNNQIANILDKLDNMPWSYSHVGTELRVDTKMSPYLKPDADVACCHDLEAYLHLVDGFLASNCPFRPNAKRSLLKLLSEQGSNVKKLYTSKTKSMTLKIEGDGVVSTMSNCMQSHNLQHE